MMVRHFRKNTAMGLLLPFVALGTAIATGYKVVFVPSIAALKATTKTS